ncbi:MAG: hypothetical protein ACTHW1_04980 [Ancrocorticia sp.]|uniref:hypothetical protein n=1 Tax=Ancrocorticia sp. TaxID=2593684 RepID=UPI003F8FCF85
MAEGNNHPDQLDEGSQDAAGGTTDSHSSGLSPEDIAYMERVQKKRLVITIILGVILLVVGFFAGTNLASLGSQAPDHDQQAVSEEISAGTAWEIQLPAGTANHAGTADH